MKRKMPLAGLVFFGCALFFALAGMARAQLSAAFSGQSTDVCWKDSYGRGVGSLPTTCLNGQNDAGLCYPACPPGSTGVGPLCHQNCPAGYGFATAVDISCSKPRDFARAVFINTGTGPEQCLQESKGRGCELVGNLLLPKPPVGYECAGPACKAVCPANMTNQGLFCGKQRSVGRGVGTIPTCEPGLINDAGLCYKPCDSGFYGVGPMCFASCGGGKPVACGAICGKTVNDCVAAIGSQIFSVLDVALTVAETVVTFGAAPGAKAAAASAAQVGVTAVAQSTAKVGSKAAAKKIVQELFTEAGVGLTEAQAANLGAMAAGEQFDFTSLDPTGIASVVAAFNKPVCVLYPKPLPPGVSNAPQRAQAGTIYDFHGLLVVDNEGYQHRISREVVAGCGIDAAKYGTNSLGRFLNETTMGPPIVTVDQCKAVLRRLALRKKLN